MVISEKLPSRLEIIPDFISTSIEKIKTLPLTEQELFNIKLSLGEALINAVKHGNKLNPDLSVEVTIQTDGDRLTITVTDQGKGFEFKNIPDPTTDNNLQKNSGRGIFLIRNLMDKVDFFDGGRGIKMIKFFKKGAKGEDKRRETQ